MPRFETISPGRASPPHRKRRAGRELPRGDRSGRKHALSDGAETATKRRERMGTKRQTRGKKAVKSLKAKSLGERKAKSVKGGIIAVLATSKPTESVLGGLLVPAVQKVRE